MSNNQKEKLQFQTEVQQLLHLMIHSLYSHKEIFLRELISNAADAIDKARFISISDPTVLGDEKDFGIEIKLDKTENTLKVIDNGIGMNREEMIHNLGTIAHSGTKAFVQKMSEEKKKDMSLIGQFGVGFYSAFMVAERVEVHSRKLDEEQGWLWSSEGTGEFTIEERGKEGRGTEVTLYLKEEEREYLEEWTVRSTIQKYSEFISWPMKLSWMKSKWEGEGENAKESFEPALELLNEKPAIWRRAPSELTDEQYKEFYHHIAHTSEDPLLWSHNRVEGTNEFSQLVYIPKKAPYGIHHTDFNKGVKLYVRRIFVMDEAKELLPNWLRFVQGVVDSEDLPLNVSREILQENKQVDAIRKHLTKKVLEALQKFSEDDPAAYAEWWNELGMVLKEGFYMNWQFLDELKALLRFHTSFSDAAHGLTSLKEYLSRMPESQKEIFVLTGENSEAVRNSPHLETVQSKGYEVLLLTDPVDEWMLQFLHEFEGKKLRNIAQGELDIADSADKKRIDEQQKGPFANLLKAMQEHLSDKLSEVRLTSLLKDSPSRIVAQEGVPSMRMEQMMRHAGGSKEMTKRILELNPEHAIAQQLLNSDNLEEQKEWFEYLYGQAVISEGAELQDPGAFAKLLNKLVSRSL